MYSCVIHRSDLLLSSLHFIFFIISLTLITILFPSRPLCDQAKADADRIKDEVEVLKGLKARLQAVNPLSALLAPAKGKAATNLPGPSASTTSAASAGVDGKKSKVEKVGAEGKDKEEGGKKNKGAANAAAAAAPAAAIPSGAPGTPALGDAEIYGSVDVRMGVITEAWEHPSSDKLWCERIDVGEGTVREIGSGLRAYYTKEQMVGARVCVVCNLKPIKLGGFPSNGMVLCTKGCDGSVEFLVPPEDAKPGDRLLLPGAKSEAASPSQMQKHKIWEKVAPLLQTNTEGLASVGGHVLLFNGKPCKPSRAINAPIS